MVTTHKNEEPPFEKTLEIKLLNALKATHITLNDLNQALYGREIEKIKQIVFAKIPPPHTHVKDKVLYICLRVNQIVAFFLISLPSSMSL